jgi:hypothetical protein
MPNILLAKANEMALIVQFQESVTPLLPRTIADVHDGITSEAAGSDIVADDNGAMPPDHGMRFPSPANNALYQFKQRCDMAVTAIPGNAVNTNNQTPANFEASLDVAKASQILVDYLKEKGQSAINKEGLGQLASNASGTPANVSAAADYMLKNNDLYTAIETHDVPGADGLSGVWNFEWAAKGGLAGNSTDALARMTDAFDLAIRKSSEITELTTDKKVGLDASKQRANA